jgi:multiple sugar transport system ATP-binding protein
MATVSLEHVHKTYQSKQGPVYAVCDFDIEVADRELVTFVGPSGCGKTTTLRLIAGLEEVTEGTIRIGDRVVNNLAPKDRDIAMVFQNYALYPHMSVFNNMAFGLRMRGVPRAERRKKVKEAAALLGIEHLLGRKPKALSGGERQRVAVGRAIVRDPQVFLFDEPLSNLDAKLRVHMRTEIKRLQRQLATTTIYVTHDQEEAMTLADRLVIMKDGIVQQSGTPMEVYRRPANRFVAGFFGTPAMNFIKGRLRREGDGLVFAGGGVCLPLPEEQASLLSQMALDAVVLGIRAEHLGLRRQADMGDETRSVARTSVEGTALAPVEVDMMVETVEPLGDSQNVFLLSPTRNRLVARISSSIPAAPGESFRVLFDANQVHLFAADEAGGRLV